MSLVKRAFPGRLIIGNNIENSALSGHFVWLIEFNRRGGCYGRCQIYEEEEEDKEAKQLPLLVANGTLKRREKEKSPVISGPFYWLISARQLDAARCRQDTAASLRMRNSRVIQCGRAPAGVGEGGADGWIHLSIRRSCERIYLLELQDNSY